MIGRGTTAMPTRLPDSLAREILNLVLATGVGFLRRNGHLIRSKKAVKFDNKRAEWCYYLNIQEMYEEIYKNLFTAGIACEHPEPLWRDENGNVVESEENAFG
jgi:hypothetical protein